MEPGAKQSEKPQPAPAGDPLLSAIPGAGSVAELQAVNAGPSLLSEFATKIAERIAGEPQARLRLENEQGKAQILMMAGLAPESNSLSAQWKEYSERKHWAADWAQSGVGFLKATALFMPGGAGRFASAVVYSADAVHTGDSAAGMVFDAALGAGKGYGLKRGFDYLGARQMALVPKALMLGTGSRLVEFGLDRHNYLNPKTGDLDISGGLNRSLTQAFKPESLAADVVIFGGAHLAMKALPLVGASEYLKRNPAAQGAVGGSLFGASSGTLAEISRQDKQGEERDWTRVAKSSIRQGGLDALAGYIGGKMHMSGRFDSSKVASDINIMENLRRTTGDGKVRTFEVTSGQEKLMALLERSAAGPVMLKVRESTSGTLAGEKSLLIQHREKGQTIDAALAARADLIAACNPELLSQSLRSKHLFGASEGALYLSTRPGSRLLAFTPAEPTAVGGLSVRKLGDVSDLLRDPKIPERFRDLHDLDAMARAMEHYREPARRLLGGGAESMVVELRSGEILKILDKPWQPEWGTRTFMTEKGLFQMDARLSTKPRTVVQGEEAFTYFVQEKARSPVSKADAIWFDKQVEKGGLYTFWDKGLDGFGVHQLGYIKPFTGGGRRIALLDYGAVVPRGQEPWNRPQSEKVYWWEEADAAKRF